MSGWHRTRTHSQADDVNLVSVKDAVVIDKHALWEGRIRRTLDLNMNEQPRLRSVHQEDLHQLVCITTSYSGVTDDAFEFFVQKFVASVPGNISMDIWEKEGNKGRKIRFDCLLPRAVVVTRGG